MAKDSFAVFILTHGRPNNVKTYRTLRKRGYTGEIYLIVDDEDKSLVEYRNKYGDEVIVFSKTEIASLYDEADNFNDRRAVFYARNACFRIAESLGLDYFLQLDDDYDRINWRFNADMFYANKPVEDLDVFFSTVLDYYKNIPALTIALAQSGDFVGGAASSTCSKAWAKRKAMNTFFCSTKRPFPFLGRVNEDVNTYITLGHRGQLMLTIFSAFIYQGTTQQNAGGMTEMYVDSGTYIKSFYTVMHAPSCVKIGSVGLVEERVHHAINWPSAAPCILREDVRKASQSQSGDF